MDLASRYDKVSIWKMEDLRRKSLKDVLEERISPSELGMVPRSFDTVGDIAIIKVPEMLWDERKTIAEAVMEINKHLKTVLCQTSPVKGSLRLRKLKWVAGEKKTETIHREYGCVFKTDLLQVYFSPRLSYERYRIAKLIQHGEVVVNMFAGVGCFSIIIARHSRANKIFSIDINARAEELMRENAKLNGVEDRVIAICGDSKRVVEENLRNVADRVLMPLPEKAYEYLEVAFKALKSTGGWIHYYDFVHARRDEDPLMKVANKISKKLEELEIFFESPFSRVVRTVRSNWYQVAFDIRILEKSV